MNEIQRLFKLLLSKEFYENHRHRIPRKSFDGIGKELIPTLEYAHDKFQRDLAPNEIYHIHNSINPTLTTARKNSFELWLSNLEEIAPMSADVAAMVYKTMWKKDCGREIAEMGIELMDGRLPDTSDITSFINKIGQDFVPEDYAEPVDINPISLFNRLNKRGKWVFNIPYLKDKIRNVSPGNFINILARPESGKTATIVHLMASRGGFADQGANIHLIANEEGADATAGRAMCCYNEVNYEDARANPSLLDTPEWAKIQKNLTFLHSPEMTISQLDYYVKVNKPDILIIDQLPHVSIKGDYGGSHERLGAIYRKAREMASIRDCVVIGVNQASVEAEGKSVVTFSMCEGSKTAIAAAADIVIGVGKTDEMEQFNEVIRHFTVSKNKISGWKGTVPVRLMQNQSRLTE